MKLIKLTEVFLLIKDGFCLFFILLGASISTRLFEYYWNKYKVYNIPPCIFNLCVNWLNYTGKKYNLSYKAINVIIFCVIWPLITIISLMANILLVILIQAYCHTCQKCHYKFNNGTWQSLGKWKLNIKIDQLYGNILDSPHLFSSIYYLQITYER